MDLNKITSYISDFFASFTWLACIFFISGISALIYQIVWQRSLFTILGVDIESVTVIVSIFMFGLGMGALIGGYLQRKFPSSLLKIFFVFEIVIGLYGLVSIYLITIAGNISASGSIFSLAAIVFVVLAIPTLLMGATLPILVSYLNNYYQNIGRSLSLLYSFNTLGAGVSALLTVEVLFVFLGQKATLLFAAFCNILTAYLVYRFSIKIKKQPPSKELIKQQEYIEPYFSYAFVLIISAAIGYISLSQEILWYRAIGFIAAGKSEVFGLVLAAFLIGVAAGSRKVESVCKEGNIYNYLIELLTYSCIVYYLSFPVISYGMLLFSKGFFFFLLIAVLCVAFLTGAVFPILAHISSKSRNMDRGGVSLVYFCNILGSILGPLVTGFILLEYFSLKENILIITVLSMGLACIVIFSSPSTKQYKAKAFACIALLAGIILFSNKLLYANLLENLQYGNGSNNKPFKNVIENRSGIVTVEASDKGDIVYGGGVYDGTVNTDPVINSNLITRAYMLAAMHPKPERVLEIGLSSGSWAKVLASYKPIKELISVEINKGYADLINNYPEHKAALTDKKVKLYFDDGRRWLKRNPSEKFDVIVMNTTFYWRNNSTNLVSVEFLELCKKHLNKGGIVYYNTTGSEDIIFTAAHVFPYVTKYMNFVAASDSPFTVSDAQKKENFMQFIDDNQQPVFKNNHVYQDKLAELMNYKFPDARENVLKKNNLWLITDDNMATEYKVDR